MRLGGRCSDGDRLALVAELDLALAVLLSGCGGLGALAGLALPGRGESGDGEHQRECEDGSEDDADSLTAVHGVTLLGGWFGRYGLIGRTSAPPYPSHERNTFSSPSEQATTCAGV